MRRALTLLAIACAGLAGACGGDDGDSDDAEVRRVATEFASAMGGGNGERACRQLTAAGRKALVETVTAAFVDPVGIGCEEAATELANDVGPKVKSALLNPKIAGVEIAGDNAEVRFQGVPGVTRLSNAGGDWQVAGTSIGT